MLTKPTNQTKQPRRQWLPMTLARIGRIQEVVRGGGGKLSIPTADSGDIRKPKGQG